MLLRVAAQDTLSLSHSFAIPKPDDGEPSDAPQPRIGGFWSGESLVAARVIGAVIGSIRDFAAYD
jgi:hypothetical protein